jgi:hypothetical protein
MEFGSPLAPFNSQFQSKLRILLSMSFNSRSSPQRPSCLEFALPAVGTRSALPLQFRPRRLRTGCSPPTQRRRHYQPCNKPASQSRHSRQFGLHALLLSQYSTNSVTPHIFWFLEVSVRLNCEAYDATCGFSLLHPVERTVKSARFVLPTLITRKPVKLDRL